jgi:L-asparaginase
MKEKNICLLFSGGTIGMVKDPETGALRPPRNPLDFEQSIPELAHLPDHFPDERPRFAGYEFIANLDSTNVGPEHWQQIAEAVYQRLDRYDGFVITHGTDTMVYTAAALSFMLRGLNKPIVFTGSQIPLAGHLITDARRNLLNAFRAAALDFSEVAILFGSRLLRATRAIKLSGFDFDAFTSFSVPPLGRVGIRLELNQSALLKRPTDKGRVGLEKDLNPNVVLLKIAPGIMPQVVDAIVDTGIDGLIIEAFGAGNIPNEDAGERSLLASVARATELGVVVVICTQVHIGAAELIYVAGKDYLGAGALPGYDMTPEAALVKLMWLLGKYGNDRAKIRESLVTPYAGEVTPPGAA